MYTPRTISSSVRRAQSAASRLVRKVLITVGQPCLRITAFQVADGVLRIVAIAPSEHRCSENVPRDTRTESEKSASD